MDATGLAMAAIDLAAAALAVAVAESAARASYVHSGASALVRCERRGRGWSLHWAGRCLTLPDSRGLTYLSVLLAHPGRPIAAVELAMGPAPEPPDPDGVPQPLLDARAVQEYRRRLAALQDELDRLDRVGDQAGAIRAQAERDWLVAQLRGATGLAGRARTFTTTEERARIAVGKAIRRALAQIGRADPALGRLLADRVHTGRHCVYLSH
jgi:uncharacterized small protein (DUF1192 family)